MTDGTIKASTVGPAIGVWVPNRRRVHPLSAVRRTEPYPQTGEVRLDRCVTLARWRSVATSDFFVRVPEAL